MLFFFEVFLFVLAMVTLGLGEFMSRWLALVVWTTATALALIGYVFAKRSVRGLLAGETFDFQHPEAAESDESAPPPPTRLDDKWARTLLYTWRRTNAVLIVGVVAVGVWYWLGT